MKDLTKLQELINSKIKLADIMVSYNVEFQYDPRLASEVQCKCPFHGRDTKPSARLYNGTNTFFCWVCRKTWDVVSFIQEKENFYYKQAIFYILNRFRIDTSSIPDTPQLDFREETIVQEDKRVSFHNIYTNILNLRKKIPFEKYRILCAGYLMVKYQDSLGEDVVGNLKKIEDKIKWLNHPLT